MSNLTRKLLILSCFLFTGFCFWKAGTGLIGDADTEILPSAQAAMSPSVKPPRVVTTPIQQMRPGMRVLGRNPDRIQTESTIDPTPEGWRLLSVRMLKQDGSYFEAELLRPLSWISRHQAQPGAVIELNMPELHVVGAAEVLSISDFPPIDPGDGPVVLSTFKNVANNVLNIYVEGETEPIGVTAGHPIWSEDRQAFVHSEKLQPGERLRSAVGRTVRITSIEIRAGPETVYGLEVAGEHVYQITNAGLLVHNASGRNATREQPRVPKGEPGGGQFKPQNGDEVRPGGSRELRVQQKLELAFKDASVQREHYLRGTTGQRVKDPLTGEGRRLDHVIIRDGKVVGIVETTSKTASKSAQTAKEMRIRGAGGTFIRDKNTGVLIDVSDVQSRTFRVD